MAKGFKNKVLSAVDIESPSSDGKCIARWQERVIFVDGVAPGDVADIKIIGKKKNYLEAIPQNIVKPSPFRSDPFCTHFGTCGGCKWQHLDYQYQLEFKRDHVKDCLQRIGKIEIPPVNPTVASPQTRFYRNKLEFTFSNHRWLEAEEIRSGEPVDRRGLGFHKPRHYDKVVDLQECYLQPEPSNSIRLWLRSYCLEHQLEFYDLKKQQGFLRNLVIRTSTSGEVMAILQVGQNHLGHIVELLSKLNAAFPEITSLNYVVNTKGNETFYDLPVINFSGTTFITEIMGKLKFRVGPKSFYQTNSEQARQLYDKISELAQLKGNETVFDLYCGTGTISLYLAASVSNVIGFEQVDEAVDNARFNADLNHLPNTSFHQGDLKETLREVCRLHPSCDVLITDPPRAGMHEDVVQQILKISPPKIIYVSCNPATQARDLALMDHKYRVDSVHPFDMFPHTTHIECVVLLKLRSD